MSHIQGDEEYTHLLERIVKGAEFLDNPLIKETDYERGMKKYDRLCEEVRAYRTNARE